MLFLMSRKATKGVAKLKKSTLLKKLILETGKTEEQVKQTLSHIHLQLFGLSGESGKFGSAKIPLEYNDLFLFNSPAKDAQPATYELLESYVKSFRRYFANPEEESIKNLYLWSPEKGNGKTSTAAALLNEYMFTAWKASVKLKATIPQPPAYFLDVNSLQTLYNRFTRQGVSYDVTEEASRKYYAEMDVAKAAPMLVADDIGVRSATEAFRADLHEIINYRMVKGLPTIYTSNLPLVDMEQVFDERLYDRMRDKTVMIRFEGDSKRGVKNKSIKEAK